MRDPLPRDVPGRLGRGDLSAGTRIGKFLADPWRELRAGRCRTSRAQLCVDEQSLPFAAGDAGRKSCRRDVMASIDLYREVQRKGAHRRARVSGALQGVVIDRDEPAYLRTVSDCIHLDPARTEMVNQENPLPASRIVV